MPSRAFLPDERARRVVRRSTHRVVGRFPSQKSARMIHWESQLERDLILQLEFDPTVLDFREQPETIRLAIGSDIQKYTPDLFVRGKDGAYIIEVKPAKRAERPEWLALFESAREHYAGRGIRFEVLTEQEIRVQPRLQNIALLLRYRPHIVDADLCGALIGEAGASGCELEALRRRAESLRGGLRDIYALVAQHRLLLNLDQPLSDASILSVPTCLQSV